MAQSRRPDSDTQTDRDTRATPSPKAPGQPATGSPVSLVPAGDARLLTGTLLWWDEPRSDEKSVVRAGVDIAPTSAHGGAIKVWATTHSPGGDTVVLSADAERGETAHTLLLYGRVAAREPRRRSVRASAQLAVDVIVNGSAGGAVSGRTLDLSRGGCRIALDDPAGASAPTDVRSGTSAEVVIHLDRHNRPRLSGHVQAVRPGGQWVIRFQNVPDGVVEQIERYVYATLP